MVLAAVWGCCAARGDIPGAESAPIRIDAAVATRAIFTEDSLSVAYSPAWQDAVSTNDATAVVTLTGGNLGTQTLKEGKKGESGSFAFDLTTLAAESSYEFKHAIKDTQGNTVNELGKRFTVLDLSQVYLHGGTLTSNETWKADRVHVVTADVNVPSAYTITFEAGAIVKFASGTGIYVANGRTIYANGVVFTHINDDTIGGDTLYDGDAAKPEMDAYKLDGNWSLSDDCEMRFAVQPPLSGTISSSRTLRRNSLYEITGTLTLNSGVTLTIPEGVIFKIAAGASIVVNSGATLNANGTRAAPIVFTSIKDDAHGGDTNGDGDKTLPQPGDWYQIRAAGTVNMEHCFVGYNSSGSDQGGIQGAGGTVTFNNSEIAHTQYECVRMNSGSFVANNSIFRDSSMGFGYYGGSGTKCYNCVVADVTVGCRSRNKYFYNTVFYRVQTFTDQSGDSSSFDRCVFYNPQGYGAQSYTKVGQNGNIWGDPKFVDPDNGDFRTQAGSACVDAGDGTVAPETDYYGQPRMDVAGVKDTGVPNADGVCPDIGIYEMAGRMNKETVDFVPLSLTVPANGVAGGKVAVSYVVMNRTDLAATGSVRDRFVFVGDDADTQGLSVDAGTVVQHYALAASGRQELTATLAVPPLKPGTWRLEVRVNSERDVFENQRANNARLSEGAIEIALNTITSGQTDYLVNGSAETAFAVARPADFANCLILTVPGQVEVFGAVGFVPSAANFTISSVPLADGRVLLVFPETDEPLYVTFRNPNKAEAAVQIAFGASKMNVFEICQTKFSNGGVIRLPLIGTGLDGAKVALVCGKKELVATKVESVGNARALCEFPADKTFKGVCDLVVAKAGFETITKAGAIEVTSSSKGPNLVAKLQIPSAIRDGRVYPCWVEYSNTGDEEVPVPIFVVRRKAGGALLATDRNAVFDQTEIHLLGLSPTVPCGYLKPGDSGKVGFFVRSMNQLSLSLGVVTEKAQKTGAGLNGFATLAEYQAAMAEAATRLALRGNANCGFTETLALALNEKRGATISALSGTVRHAVTKEPLADVLVALRPKTTNDNHTAVYALSDAAGFFTLESHETGDFILSCPEMETSDAKAYALAGGDVNNVELQAVPYNVVKGTVLDEQGLSTVGDVVVGLIGNGEIVRQVKAGTDGAFTFDQVAGGDYSLLLYPNDGFCMVTSTVFTVTNGVTVTKDIAYGDTGLVIAGKVVHETTGDVVTNGVVVARNQETGYSYMYKISANGSYRFDGVEKGAYDLLFESDRYVVSRDLVLTNTTVEVQTNLTLNVLEMPPFRPTSPVGMIPHTTDFTHAIEGGSDFRWDFDNDGVVDSTAQSPSWTYATPSNYFVRLTYVDGDNVEHVTLFRNAVTVLPQIENKLNENGLLLTDDSGVEIVEVSTNRLVLAGLPSGVDAYVAGMVIGRESMQDGFIRKVLSVARDEDGRWVLEVEPGEIGDLYDSYYRTTNFEISRERLAKMYAGAVLQSFEPSNEKLVDVEVSVGINDFEAALTGSLNRESTGAIMGLYTEYSYETGGLFPKKHSAKIFNSIENYTLIIGVKVKGEKSEELIKPIRHTFPKVPAPFVLDPFTGLSLSAQADVVFTTTASISGELSFNCIVKSSQHVWNHLIDNKKLESETIKNDISKPEINVAFAGEGKVEASFSVVGGIYLSWLNVIGRVGGGLKARASAFVAEEVKINEYGNDRLVDTTFKVGACLGVGLEASARPINGIDLVEIADEVDFEYGELSGHVGVTVGNATLGVEGNANIFESSVAVMLDFESEASLGDLDFTAKTDKRDAFFTSKPVCIEAEGWAFGWLDGKELPFAKLEWNFGDGGVGEGKTTSHAYAKNGSYMVVHKEKINVTNLGVLSFMDLFRTKRKTINVFEDEPPEDENKDDEAINPVKSCDPNEMSGPLGEGDPETERFVKPGEWMDYTIYYENKTNATAAAQEVFVDAQLSEYLDWSTFEMKAVSFGEQIDMGLEGRSSGASEVTMDGTNFLVRTALTFDETTGKASWYMRIKDPTTDDSWPADQFAGFLPPNDPETHCGEGYISYRVKVRDDAPAGARIDASADIVFDHNEVIVTDPAWWNTVGSPDIAFAFDKKEYKVKENVPSLKVNVKRTGKSKDAVSVRYATVAGTAKPGEDYEPVTGALSWAQGDTKAKTLVIPLIPDLKETWEGADRRFAIQLVGLGVESPIILQESAKMDVGTIQFAGEGDGTPFANPKKPAIVVPGGTPVTLLVTREGAVDGQVGVKISTKAGTKTKADVDFTNTLEEVVWNDGENTPYAFTFKTKWVDDASIADKTVTVSLTALPKGTKQKPGPEYAAKLGAAKSVTVTIRNPKVVQTLEERIAADKAAKRAVTLAGTKGVWYFDADGNLRSVTLAAKKKADLSLAVTGPGRLTFNGTEYYIGAKKETVKLSFLGGGAVIAPVSNRLLYLWEPLGTAVAITPVDKSVVAQGFTIADIRYSDAENADGYEIYITDNKSKLGKDPNATALLPGKTYYWRVDSVMLTNGVAALVAVNKTVNSFTIAAAGAPVTEVTGTDAEGTDVAGSEVVVLYQGVKAVLELGTATPAEGQVTYSVVGGKLPGGLGTSRATTGEVTLITGVPTTPGTNTVVVQAKAGKVGGVTRALTFVVKPMELALGTFAGVAEMDREVEAYLNSTNKNESLASVSLTVAKTGTLSAKVMAAGKSFTFKGTGFDQYQEQVATMVARVDPNADQRLGDKPRYQYVANLFATAKIGKETVTNELHVAVPYGTTNDADVVTCPAVVDLSLVFQEKVGKETVAHTNVYTGDLYRDNRKEASVLPTLAAWEGYYTVSLPVAESVDGMPQGAGYMTVTVDKKGSAKLVGVLGDGTSASLSAVPALDAVGNLILPIYSAKSQMAFGGELVLTREKRSDYSVADAAVEMGVLDEGKTILHWHNADPKATYGLTTGGFSLPLDATGGFYDKLVNFRRFYLDSALSVKADLEDYDSTWQPSKTAVGILADPNGEGVWFEGSKMVVDKQMLVKDPANKSLYDLAASTNASGVSVSFTRATGIFKGKFNLWFANEVDTKAQVKQAIDYAGVLTPVKAVDSPFAAKPGLGHWKLAVPRDKAIDPKKSKWTGSWLFEIGSEDVGAENAERWAGEGVFE